MVHRGSDELPKRSIPHKDSLNLLYLALLASALQLRGVFFGSGLGLDGCSSAITARALSEQISKL
jgi:hypothetical protein